MKTGVNETSQVRTPSVIAVIAGVLAVLTAIAFGFQLPFRDRIKQTYTVESAFPPPGVLPDEQARRLVLESQQRALLNGVNGHMPIEKAMEVVTGRGSRAFDPLSDLP